MQDYPFVNINADELYETQTSKTPLTLEITLSYDSLFQRSSFSMPRVCFRVGIKRLYYIFDYNAFFDAFENESTYMLSSIFTLDFSIHEFTEKDATILRLIRELHQLNYYFIDNPADSTLIEDKWIFLPDAYLNRFYQLLYGMSFKLELPSKTSGDLWIIEHYSDDFPELSFELSKDGDYFQLSYTFPLVKLTHSFEYMLLDDMILHVPEHFRHPLKILYNSLYDHVPSIKFSYEKQDHFLTEVVPFLRELGNLTLSEELQDSIIEAPLLCDIYLDKKDTYIVATLKFNYGPYEIDPFRPKDDPNMPVILRNLAKEDKILARFSDFVIKQDALYLIDEAKSFEFLTHSLPYLLEETDVFYTDAFKTIRINPSPKIQSAVSYESGDRYLDFSFQVEDISAQELHHLFDAIRLKKKYYRLKNGSYIGIEDENLGAFSTLLDQLQVNYSDLSKSSIRLPIYRAFTLDDYAKEHHLFRLNREQTFKRLVHSVETMDELEFVCPKSLQGILRDYQVTGFKWLKTLAHYGLGGILADDMGLGKTLQTLTFLVSEYEDKKQPSLIVTPTSLIYNWSEEIHKFLPNLPVCIVDGPPAEREQVISDCLKVPIVLTTYPLLRRDIDLYQQIHFSYCILDEAQHIKNPKSVTAISVKQIDADGHFALTGTPIENHLTELWSIFDFIMPQLLYSQSKFSRLFESPIVKENNGQVLTHLKQIISPFILRRLKTEVLKELPEKVETVIRTNLNEEQKKLYLAHLAEARSFLSQASDSSSENPIKILSLLTRLRQICCHPSMFMENYKGGSGKMELLEELIESTIDSGHRLLIFSQFTSMLHLIEDLLKKQGFEYAYLDGQVPLRERKEIIHGFNHGSLPIFLISLKAGGTGLNLTSADVVIHVDPWWNPAVEDQATDRAYRIGQTRHVQVYKLLAKGTIEEKIFELQRRKKSLADSIITSEQNNFESLTINEIKEIFDVD